MASFPNCMLFPFLSGAAVQRPQEVIAHELNKNKEKLLAGLSRYGRQTQPSGEWLENEKKLEGQSLEFVQKLSRYLGLNETLCYELFVSYLAYEYRSSKKCLQQILANDRHCKALIFKMRDFYFMERLYLLRCLKQVLSFGIESQHPYKMVYTRFVDSIGSSNLIASIQDQYEAVCDQTLPSHESHGTLMTSQHTAIWAKQNLQEQCELLELMVVYLHSYEPDVKKFIPLFEKFKRQGFAQHQTFKRILDQSTDELLKRLGYLQVLVILGALDFELIQRCHMAESFEGHPLLKDKHTFKRLDELFEGMGGSTFHGPLMMSWVVVRDLYLQDDVSGRTKKMGTSALRLKCFECLCDLLNMEPFNGTALIASIAVFSVYMMLYSALIVFQEDTLGDPQSVSRLSELVLAREFIADHFWERGMEDGLGTLYHSALTKFPMQFPSFMQQSIALASAGQDSAKKVLSHIQRLQVYTEYLDRDSTQDLTCVGDMLWQLTSNKYPYGTGSSYPFVIPKDTLGTIYRPDKGSPVVQWAWTYNGWNLFMCEIEQLLQQLSHGAGMVTLTQINKVTQILSLIKAVLTSDPDSTSQLEGSCNLIYHLIQRCARLSSPPLELLSNSLDCLSCVAQKHPLKVWHGLKQTGLLPFLTIGLDNMTEVLSGQGLQSGLYGSLLVGHECLKGTYPLTQAYLSLLTTMVKPLRKEKRSEELLGSVLFVLREVFPVFHKWRYYDKGRREVLLVGQKCVDLFHRILDFFAQDSRLTDTDKSVSLEKVCVHSLLFTEAGKALLDIISTGVGNIDIALSEQSSAHQGPGIDLVQLTRLGFSILNRLLLLKSPDLPMSPVENALSSQPAGRQHLHIIVTIGQYVFHRYDPRLTTIATLLLKRLAVISPMSILACLGTEAEPIRDMYLMRLQAITEDVRLKVAILELLTACVQTQPGLIELFLNIQSSAVTDGKKDLAMGKISCLQTVLDLMELKRQGTYRCPPVVLCACVQLVHALWAGLRETAMAVLRSSTSFWSNIVAPLMKDLPEDVEDNEEVRVVYVRSAAYVMKILAQEFYSVPSSKLDKTLHKVLEDLNSGKRLHYWSQCVGEALTLEGEGRVTREETLDENPSLQLLAAWKNLLITTTTQSIEELKIDESLTQQILSDLMTGLRAQFVGNMSELNVKLASVSSALYFTLIKAWRSTLKNVSTMLKEVELALVQTCTSTETLIPSVQVGLLGSALALLQRSRQHHDSPVSPESLCTLLAVLSPLVQQTTYQLHCQPQTTGTEAETVVSSEMDIKVKLEVTGLCLMCEIIDLLGDCGQWLPSLQQHTIISSLLGAVQKWMKAKEHPHCVQAALMLFLKIAQSEKGAEYLSLGGLTDHTCLHISTVYRNEDLVSLPSNLGKVNADPSGDEVTWSGVYCLCVDLYSTMLHTLRFSFLKGALDFVGIHQDRLQQVLELARFTLHEKVWREAKKTCTFIFHLSNFVKQWRFELPKVLDSLLTSMCYMCQTLVSLLIRPQYLQYLLEHQSGASNGGGREKGSGFSLSRPQSLQSQGSTEDVDQPSSQLVAAQIWMFEILGMCLSTLRHFTPGLCEVMLDMGLDISEWSPFLQLSFSTPSVDQEAPPTFGTLIAVVTVCVQHLLKTDTRAVSPLRSSSDTTQTADMSVPKSLVQFVMENSLYILLSQSCRYLKDPDLPAREKQLLKRELGTELNDFLTSYHRFLRRGGPPSPGGSQLVSPGGVGSRIAAGMQRTGPAISRSISSSTFTMAQDQAFFRLVQEFVRKVLR